MVVIDWSNGRSIIHIYSLFFNQQTTQLTTPTMRKIAGGEEHVVLCKEWEESPGCKNNIATTTTLSPLSGKEDRVLLRLWQLRDKVIFSVCYNSRLFRRIMWKVRFIRPRGFFYTYILETFRVLLATLQFI